MNKVTSLSDYRAKKSGEDMFTFRIGKFSEHRTMLMFEEPKSCVTLDRYNFERMTRHIRELMGWE
jgi:hypothetical protein